MKKLIISLLICLLFVVFYSANQKLPEALNHNPINSITALNPIQTVMNINNLTVWVRGDGFHDPVVNEWWNGSFPKGTVGFIFSEGMLWGGLVNDGNEPIVRVGGVVYKTGNIAGTILTDESGNVIGSEDPEDPSVRPFRVRSDWVIGDLMDDAANFFLIPPDEISEAQIEEIRTQYESDWNEWPSEKGAPYEEVNGIFGYQPATWNDVTNSWNSDGDVPGIHGADQTLWIVYNDLDEEQMTEFYGSPPIGLEVQETYWAYTGHNTLENVVFKKLRIIYKGTTYTPSNAKIENMYITQWADVDLGQYNDDFSGCDTILDLGFVYNDDDIDRAYNEWGLIPPAGGHCLLQGPIIQTDIISDSALFDFQWRLGYTNLPMTNFGYFGSGDPRMDPPGMMYDGTLMWYNLMRGCEPNPKYPHCNPFLDNFGTPTHFEVAGDPVQGIGDLDGHPTPDNPRRLPPGDRHYIMSTGPFSFTRGDTQEVVIALVGAIGANHLVSIAALKDNVERIRLAFESNFTNLGPGAKLVELSAPHNTEETGPFDIIVMIEDDSSWEHEIKSGLLHYSVGEIEDSVALVETMYNDTVAYLATVHSFLDVVGTTEFRYYMSINYDDETRIILPHGAPLNYMPMIFGPDTTKPVVTNLNDLPDVIYILDDKAEILANASDDRFPVSVITKWRISSKDDLYQNIMTPDGDTWVGEIYWEDLELGDTIYYWMEAVDSSINQNVGRSELKWFVAKEYGIIGNWDNEMVLEWDWGNNWFIGYESSYKNVAKLIEGFQEDEGDTLTRIDPLKLDKEFPVVFVRFFHKYAFIEPNIGFLEVKPEEEDWQVLRSYSGIHNSFKEDITSLGSYVGVDSLFLRFRAEGHGEKGAAIWHIDDVRLSIDSSLTVIGNGKLIIPNAYRLHQPYPNPFNPMTTIKFSIPRSGLVTLTVYDIIGREVETILNEYRDVGYHKVQWNANNVPSGIYLIKMLHRSLSETNDSFIKVRKAIVVR